MSDSMSFMSGKPPPLVAAALADGGMSGLAAALVSGALLQGD